MNNDQIKYYKLAIEWIALHDGFDDIGALDVNHVVYQTSTALVCSVFDVSIHEAAMAVVEYRMRQVVDREQA